MAIRAKGFTLVEVLVALLIMAVLSTMAWQGIDGMSRARTASRDLMERSQRLNTVMAQWEYDLSSIYDNGVLPALTFDGTTLRLVREAQAGVQIVAWSLRGTKLQRWAGPVVTGVATLQESWLSSQQLLGNEVAQLLLLDDVTEVRVQFYRGNSWSNAQSSGDLEPSASGTGTVQRESLPTGVRLVLVTSRGEISRDVLLAARMP